MSGSPLNDWKTAMAVKQAPVVLETGAKPWEGSAPPTDHTGHCLHAGEWLRTDIEAGQGVDIVADLHLIDVQCPRRFDGIYCPATLEHLERPWVAMRAMRDTLLPDGVLFIDTHQTFPLHGYPFDFYRFSTQALESLCRDAGLEVISSGYSNPCTIVPTGAAVWNQIADCFLNVSVCARRA